MKKGVFLIAILLVPSIVYMLFSLGEHNTRRLGYYGELERLSSDGDSVFAAVSFPKLIDVNGAQTELELNEKVKVVHLFEWPCSDQCIDNISTLNNYLAKVELKAEWSIMSICLDDINSDDLGLISSKRMYDGENWEFYKLDNPSDRQILESWLSYRSKKIEGEYIVLLDSSNRIREYFNLRLQQDNKTLQDAIKLLIQEPHISWKEKK